MIQYGREAAGWRPEKTSHFLFHNGLGWRLPGDWAGSHVFVFLSWPRKSAPLFRWPPNSFLVGLSVLICPHILPKAFIPALPAGLLEVSASSVFSSS